MMPGGVRAFVAFASVGGSLLSGCAVGPHTRAAGVVGQTTVRSVAWNPAAAALGNVRAVADTGDVVAVFADDRATVFSSRSVVAVDHTVKGWVDADTIAGADGSARWIVGVDARGHVYYLRALSSFEDVSERYGLGDRAVLTTAVLGPGFVGFLLAGEIALADGQRVTRYAAGPFDDLVGGGGYGVGVGRGGLHVFDAAHKTMIDFALPGVNHAALGPGGRLYAATRRALYAADGAGQLGLIYEADGDTIHGLVASGEHVWFADGTELGVVDGDKVLETTGLGLAASARLAASPSGDVWAMAGSSLARFSRAQPEPSLDASWSSQLAPIFARACASCHLPDGVAGTDLSTAEGWQSERAMIRDRVVIRHTMPPEGHTLGDADRTAIGAWATGP
jgi:mono/diheme cytochrome c family protein